MRPPEPKRQTKRGRGRDRKRVRDESQETGLHICWRSSAPIKSNLVTLVISSKHLLLCLVLGNFNMAEDISAE